MAEAAVERESANGAVEWRKDTRGREFVSAVGRSGVVYRQGEETIDDAYARDAEGRRNARRRNGCANRRHRQRSTFARSSTR